MPDRFSLLARAWKGLSVGVASFAMAASLSLVGCSASDTESDAETKTIADDGGTAAPPPAEESNDADAGDDAEPSSASVTIITYNLRNSNANDGDNRWDNRREAMVTYLQKLQPDIAGFQEVLPDQRAYLSANLNDYDSYGVPRDDGKEKGEASPIYFLRKRFELLASDTFWLSETPAVVGSVSWDASLTRIASWARLRDRLTGDELLAVNTHFDHVGQEARLESSRLVLRRIEELGLSRGERVPTVLTGDFNTTIGSAPYKELVASGDVALRLRDAQFLSSTPHVGGNSTVIKDFSTIEDGQKIDFIFVRDIGDVLEHRIEDPRVEGRFLSDHLPVISTLRLFGKRSAQK